MSGELSGARGHDHPAEADRISAGRMRAKPDAQARAENDACNKRHAELARDQEAASRAAAMFSPIGHVPLTQEARAAAAREAGGREAGQGAGRQAITHYFADYGGHHLDLYTDGKRWAGGYDLACEPGPEQTRSARAAPTRIPRTAAEYLRSGERVVGTPVAGEKPGKSPGGTGDLPPSGRELAEGAHENESTADKLRREVWESSDDSFDIIQNSVDDAHEIFSNWPTSSHEGTAPHGPEYSVPQHSGTDIGAGAVGLLAFGLMVERAVSLAVGHLGKHSKGD